MCNIKRFLEGDHLERIQISLNDQAILLKFRTYGFTNSLFSKWEYKIKALPIRRSKVKENCIVIHAFPLNTTEELFVLAE